MDPASKQANVFPRAFRCDIYLMILISKDPTVINCRVFCITNILHCIHAPIGTPFELLSLR